MTAQNDFHVWINRRRFDGLGETVTGGELAGLIGVPTDNARIDLETDTGALRELGVSERLAIENGMQFLVTRRYVMGGGVKEGVRGGALVPIETAGRRPVEAP